MEIPDVQVLVKSVANKQQLNKRKRDPDMYLDAVLECTVRKLNHERMKQDEALRKRRRIKQCDRATIRCTSSDTAKSSIECSRTIQNDTSNNNKTDCDIGKSFATLEDELSGDLKELLDELSKEFPCDFWLTDANNNNTNNTLIETKDSVNEGDMWLSSFIEVLCST